MKPIFLIISLLLFSCTPLEDGGRSSGPTEAYEAFHYTGDVVTGTLRLAYPDIIGRGVGNHLFLRSKADPEQGNKFIAWIDEGDVIRLTLPAGIYSLCVSSPRICRSLGFGGRMGDGVTIVIEPDKSLCLASEKVPYQNRVLNKVDCSYIDSMDGLVGVDVNLDDLPKSPIPY